MVEEEEEEEEEEEVRVIYKPFLRNNVVLYQSKNVWFHYKIVYWILSYNLKAKGIWLSDQV